MTDFIRQIIQGNVILTIEEKSVNQLDEKISEWVERSYEKNFSTFGDKRLQELTKEIFDSIIYLRLTGKLAGILSVDKFGK